MESRLDLDLLRALVAVADQGSFTRAAATLHRTQSAVSMQIARLEARLGTRLLDRGGAAVAPTPAGLRLVGDARRMLRLEAEAIGRVRDHGAAGRVRLGVMDDYGSLILPPMLAGFACAYPRIMVEMETGLTRQMPARLGRDFDLVIAMHPAGEGGGTLLAREAAQWAASSGWRAELDGPLALALYPAGCLFRQWAVEALERAGRPWRLAYVAHGQAAVEAIAAEGLAVTVVKSGTFPARLRPLGAAEGLPALPVADIRMHRAACGGNAESRAAILLADHLAAAFARRAALS
ncbi:DNA-binding transcriptional LysR family regulator [Stella humosa]|uniref:DNA-binding transcriptional LysR family regulator n=1 Tax=Stella humosa TaxID=94 RepID=A0A3N1L133_9PROT|nr:LysR family transcriptional regulator [Stella humosa]ROP84308.1 DNA-binding transcriptional LysR family regulator [Stella humosa]BBK33822.1 transcriptional regulator [Stella humosa]